MRMLDTWKWTAALALGALLAIPASAGTVYRWTAEDGSVSFADDAKRIPARYRDVATQVETSGLTGYKRYSPAKSEAQADYAEKLALRLERLRELNNALDRVDVESYARGAAVSQPGPETMVDVGDGLAVRIPSSAMTEETPVVIQDVRVRRPGSAFTSTDTVISQDGRVLLVVRGDRHSSNPSAGFDDERNLVPETDFFAD